MGKLAAVGAIWETTQTQRLEHKEMSATSKTNTAGKSHSRIKTGSRPIVSWGRPLTSGKKQVRALDGTVGVGDQASGERFAEIESGRTRWQQGLVATCQDSSNEAIAEGRESRMGLAHEFIGAMTEE